jgi:hypothetical protein
MIANKQVPTATNQHAITKELMEAVFSVVHASSIDMQRHGKHTPAATVG